MSAHEEKIYGVVHGREYEFIHAFINGVLYKEVARRWNWKRDCWEYYLHGGLPFTNCDCWWSKPEIQLETRLESERKRKLNEEDVAMAPNCKKAVHNSDGSSMTPDYLLD